MNWFHFVSELSSECFTNTFLLRVLEHGAQKFLLSLTAHARHKSLWQRHKSFHAVPHKRPLAGWHWGTYKKLKRYKYLSYHHHRPTSSIHLVTLQPPPFGSTGIHTLWLCRCWHAILLILPPSFVRSFIFGFRGDSSRFSILIVRSFSRRSSVCLSIHGADVTRNKLKMKLQLTNFARMKLKGFSFRLMKTTSQESEWSRLDGPHCSMTYCRCGVWSDWSTPYADRSIEQTDGRTDISSEWMTDSNELCLHMPHRLLSIIVQQKG